MHNVEDSGKGLDAGNKAGEVESLRCARQTQRVVEVISAARAKLEDKDEVKRVLMIPTIQKPKPLDQQYLRKLRTLTVSMKILVLTTVLLTCFVLTAPLHLGRYSHVRSWADIVLGISDIAVGISAIAACMLALVQNSLLRTKKPEHNQ